MSPESSFAPQWSQKSVSSIFSTSSVSSGIGSLSSSANVIQTYAYELKIYSYFIICTKLGLEADFGTLFTRHFLHFDVTNYGCGYSFALGESLPILHVGFKLVDHHPEGVLLLLRVPDKVYLALEHNRDVKMAALTFVVSVVVHCLSPHFRVLT